ncbi:hypothetical protein JCM21531_4468 [Acetivibrio straminisolvens JCM 21531]|uniref:Stage 0 sporulation protein A homolog n=2 Tax=Acetivibrio straminisolvens TaxID=253314 RepID=W4VDJ0_9FIRM|nr:hypothetical protein JCM21531_4468 [Acetivibrio straminisolvens JCM 21531]
MDMEMPICDGIEGTRLIKTKFNNTKVVILTVFNDEDRIKKCIELWRRWLYAQRYRSGEVNIDC